MESDTMKRSSWLSAGGTEGVLGRDADKGRGKGVRFAVHSDGVLLHDLKQRGLGFRGGSVDFVREKQLAVRRAVAVLELARLAVPHGEAGDVGREGVGGELDAARRKAERTRKRDREGGLADARAVLEQHMAAGVNRHQNLLNDVVFTDKGAVYLGNDLF